MRYLIRLTGLRFCAAILALLLLPTALVGGFALLFLDGGGGEDSSAADLGGEETPVVILDPGHGGMDGGAVSVTGTLEKELNLKMALGLRAILEACGVRVLLTREQDEMLDSPVEGSRKMKDLSGRLAVMKAYPDALFVSVHMNRFSSPSCRGTQVWYAPGNEDARVLADAVAAAVRQSVQPENTRLSKEADEGIYLLHRASTCAVLVECGFLSSPEEALLLEDPLYRDRLAAAIARAILERIGNLGARSR